MLIPIIGILILIMAIIIPVLLIIVLYGFFFLKEVSVRENEDFLLIVRCAMNTWIIPVDEMELKDLWEVVKIRVAGISLPSAAYGIYHGPYGMVNVMARTKKGLLVRSRKGKLYFIGARNAEDIYSHYLRKRGEEIELP
jgi:hypothetical protein